MRCCFSVRMQPGRGTVRGHGDVLPLGRLHHERAVGMHHRYGAHIRVRVPGMSERGSGEEKNGDNLVMVQDPRIATSYAIEALRVFDHLEFRTKMKEAPTTGDPLTLKKPTSISGQPAWFEKFYAEETQLQFDRKLFAH